MFDLICRQCNRATTTTQPAKYCTAACRWAAARGRAAEHDRAKRVVLATGAQFALDRGDVAALTDLAHRTVALLTPAD